MRLFEYAIIYEGKQDENDEWVEKPELITRDECLCETQAHAQIIASRAIPEEYVEKGLDRITVALRPF